MATVKKSYWDNLEFEKEITQPIVLNLNNNELVFKDGKRWTLAQSDIECAIEEIDRLTQSLAAAEENNRALKQEIAEITEVHEKTSSVVVEMVNNCVIRS
jgi:hypothetical protein